MRERCWKEQTLPGIDLMVGVRVELRSSLEVTGERNECFKKKEARAKVLSSLIAILDHWDFPKWEKKKKKATFSTLRRPRDLYMGSFSTV